MKHTKKTPAEKEMTYVVKHFASTTTTNLTGLSIDMGSILWDPDNYKYRGTIKLSEPVAQPIWAEYEI